MEATLVELAKSSLFWARVLETLDNADLHEEDRELLIRAMGLGE